MGLIIPWSHVRIVPGPSDVRLDQRPTSGLVSVVDEPPARGSVDHRQRRSSARRQLRERSQRINRATKGDSDCKSGGSVLIETVLWKHRIAVLFAVLNAVSAIAISTAGAASADGRTLVGSFCTLLPPATAVTSHICMTITFDGVTVGTPTRTDPTQPDLALRPGTYWITVSDNSNFHNFSLRGCPGSTSLCTSDNPASGGTDQGLTPICNDPLTAAGTCGVTP
jgi:hypothetical protein